MTDILEKYLGLPDDSPERAMMETRFGRSALEKLVREHDEELAFQEWLRQRTKMPCPGCDLLVEKHSGCNHVRAGRLCSLDEPVADDQPAVPTDEVPPVQAALLLPVWDEAGPRGPLRAFLDTWAALLRQGV